MRKSKNGNSVTMLLMLKIRNKEKKNLFHTPCIIEFFLNLGLNQRKTGDPLRRQRGRRRSRQ